MNKKKTFIVQIDNKNVRSIFTDELIHIGSVIEDQNWLGRKIKGGKVVKVF